MKPVGIVLIIGMLSLPCPALTLSELADAFQAMESSIQDVTVVYEWHNQEQLTPVPGTLVPVTKEVCSFTTARPFADRQLYSVKVDLAAEGGEIVPVDERHAYNGEVFRRLAMPGPKEPTPRGLITKRRDMLHQWTCTPMAFTILRDMKEGLLSQLLREHPEAVRLAGGTGQIRDFRTVELDFVTPQGLVHRRYFFSVDHGYAPVRMEWLAIRDGTVQAETDVLALKEVAPGFWFPVKATTRVHVEDDTANVYEAKDVKLNQNLSQAYFDLDFPPGTVVTDEIANSEYTSNSTARASRREHEERPAGADQSTAQTQSSSDDAESSADHTGLGIWQSTSLIALVVLAAIVGVAVLRRRR